MSPPSEAELAQVDVCIVGGGPTGLAAANLLGSLGLDVLIAERNVSTSSEAKAISLDDESLRSLQQADLLDELRSVILPGTGTRYYGACGQELFYATGPSPLLYGHPFKNPFAQPDLERVLMRGLARFPHVRVMLSTELTRFRAEGDHVHVGLRTGQSERSVRSRFLVGCDGGRSTVREHLGIRLVGSSFSQRWLVVDSLRDHHDERYGMHHGCPSRPTVIIPGRHGRCRYEFLLRDDEGVDGEASFPLVRGMLEPHRRIEEGDIERSAIYRFHALNAESWRRGPVFLAGDAAHMMPPFAGQGLNSGIRDVANLSWKLSETIRCPGGDGLLDTYENECRAHAQKMIDLSVRLGKIVMTTSWPLALARDAAVSLMRIASPGRRYLGEMRYRPRVAFREGFVSAHGRQHPLTGKPIPQPRVLCADGEVVRLDVVLADGYTLLAVEPAAPSDPSLCHPLWDLIQPNIVTVNLDDRFPMAEARRAIADFDGGLRRALDAARGKFVLVRPDRVVAATFDARETSVVADALYRIIKG